MRTLKAEPLIILLCNLIYKSITDVLVVTLRLGYVGCKCGLCWLFTEHFIVTLNCIKPGTHFESPKLKVVRALMSVDLFCLLTEGGNFKLKCQSAYHYLNHLKMVIIAYSAQVMYFERNMGNHRQKIKHFKASYLIIIGHAGSNAQLIVKHEKKTIGLKPCFRPFLVNQSRSFPCKGDREGENVPLHFTPSLPVAPVSRLFKAP